MRSPTKKITNMADAVAELRNLGIKVPKQLRELDSKAKLPRGYSYRSDRSDGQRLYLYFQETRLGRAIYVLAEARDKEDGDWGRLLGFVNRGNTWHTVFISDTELMSTQVKWLDKLVYKGWSSGIIESGIRRHIADFVHEYPTDKCMRLVDSVGWHKGAYVLPNRVIGTIEGEQPLLYPPLKTKFKIRGTLEDWQKTIGTWARGNTRMTMAISATLATFLLRYRNEDSFDIHFWDDSTRGKTTSILAAASCCGRGSKTGGYINSWYQTATAIGSRAAQHNDAPLFLDETGLAETPKDVAKAAYLIATGQTKGRSKPDGSIQDSKGWSTIAISTGEKSFTKILAEANMQATAGQLVRFLSIPGPEDSEYGFFEDVHGYDSGGGTAQEIGDAFAKAIEEAAVTDFGHVAPAFIEHLIDAGHAKNKAQLKRYVDENLDRLYDAGKKDPQVRRVAMTLPLASIPVRS